MTKATIVEKATKVKKVARSWPKSGTIGFIALNAIIKTNKYDATFLKNLTNKIIKKFPESKFGKTHLSWYLYQLSKGRYIPPKLTKSKKLKKS